MFLCFFTTIPNEEDMTEETDRKLIICTYLKGWWIIDFLSIVPINDIVEIFVSEEESGDLDDNNGTSMRGNLVIRAARGVKLYKLMRLFRLVKVFKLLKNKDKL